MASPPSLAPVDAALVAAVHAARNALQCAERLWIGCSGGPDSLALAWAAVGLRGRDIPGFRHLGLLHVHHGQHPSADLAANLVAEFARRFGLEHAESRPELAPGASEDAMRDARLAAFADRLGAPTGGPQHLLLLAQHRDDQLETVLFRARRGPGRRGWAGIPRLRQLPPAGPLLLRPALELPGDQLRAALRDAPADLAPIDDPSNRDLRFARNAIRHRELPGLRARWGHRLDARLLARIERVRELVGAADRAGAALLRDHTIWRAPWGAVLRLPAAEAPIVAASRQPSPLASAAGRLHRALLGRAPAESWLDRVEALVHSAANGRRVRGSGTLLVERCADGLLFVDCDRAGAAPATAVPLPIGEHHHTIRFGDTEWTVDCGAAATTGEASWQTPLPAAGAAGWRLRTRRAGDRLADGTGLAAAQRAAAIPRFDRDRLPVLVDADDRPIWSPGLPALSYDAGCRTLRVACGGAASGIPALAFAY